AANYPQAATSSTLACSTQTRRRGSASRGSTSKNHQQSLRCSNPGSPSVTCTATRTPNRRNCGNGSPTSTSSTTSTTSTSKRLEKSSLTTTRTATRSGKPTPRGRSEEHT